MVSRPILSLKRSVTIDTMINFDDDGDGDGHGNGSCKQTFNVKENWISHKNYV